MTYLVTISPKGQITIPVAERKKLKHKKYLLEVNNKTIILKPVEIKIVSEEKQDDLKQFSALADSSFSFWDNAKDDVYQQFYQ